MAVSERAARFHATNVYPTPTPPRPQLLSGQAPPGLWDALTDPEPPTVRELVDTFARHLGRRVVWVPLPQGLTRAAVGLPGMGRLLGVPAESVDYFAQHRRKEHNRRFHRGIPHES